MIPKKVGFPFTSIVQLNSTVVRCKPLSVYRNVSQSIVSGNCHNLRAQYMYLSSTVRINHYLAQRVLLNKHALPSLTG